MHTVQALGLISRAVRLADNGFAGDCLEEACKDADPLDRDAVRCILRSRQNLYSGAVLQPPEMMEALRSLTCLYPGH